MDSSCKISFHGIWTFGTIFEQIFSLEYLWRFLYATMKTKLMGYWDITRSFKFPILCYIWIIWRMLEKCSSIHKAENAVRNIISREWRWETSSHSLIKSSMSRFDQQVNKHGSKTNIKSWVFQLSIFQCIY